MSEYIIDDMSYTREDICELLETKNNGYGALAGAYSSAIVFGFCNVANASVVKEISKVDIKPNIENVIVEQSAFSLEDYENVFLIDDYNHLLKNEVLNKKKKEIIESILSFKSLQESWDGYGAFPLQVKSAVNAIDFLEVLDLSSEFYPPTDIFPNPSGTASLIWENDDEERISLEIGNNAMSYYTKFNGSDVGFFDNVEINEFNIGNITRKIQALY
ncbi:hypothetical protein [Flavobacterium sp. HTF]|uniref:hypothetical protein n=1 Tax=Flavobacterium sp. HTF TaxID=2170732 RepID=UPI000D5E44AD|nr:hypothetical protein [Flavobacterium sp. HTF]PWB23889.1 hypothetical protein DCO46_13215 [Flavobacterium sp. HTF]